LASTRIRFPAFFNGRIMELLSEVGSDIITAMLVGGEFITIPANNQKNMKRLIFSITSSVDVL
jgi:hypothetical protein